jgi:hypothetical protein
LLRLRNSRKAGSLLRLGLRVPLQLGAAPSRPLRF